MSLADVLPDWTTPERAVMADYGSQQRLQAWLICNMLDIAARIEACDERRAERKLQVVFDNLRSISIANGSLMKGEGR